MPNQNYTQHGLFEEKSNLGSEGWELTQETQIRNEDSAEPYNSASETAGLTVVSAGTAIQPQARLWLISLTQSCDSFLTSPQVFVQT